MRALSFRIVTRVKYTMDARHLALGVGNREKCFLMLALCICLDPSHHPKRGLIQPLSALSSMKTVYWEDRMDLNTHSSRGALKCAISCLVAAFRGTVSKQPLIQASVFKGFLLIE